jgi:hypothetical protein
VVNLRELCESDLAITLEDEAFGFGLPVVLISPDGEEDTVSGQILYDTVVQDPDTGAIEKVHKPVVTVRISSLARVPLPTERGRWAVKIPITPSRTAPKTTFILEDASEDGGSIGFIRLYLVRPKQS